MSLTTQAHDVAVALLLATLAGPGCARNEPHRRAERSAPTGSAPVASAKPLPVASVGLAPAPPAASVSKQDRERVVIDLLSGGPAASELPVVDRDPGREWNRSLRDRLAPVVGRVPWVRFSKLQVDGAIPRDVVTRVLRTRYSAFRLCYEQGLDRDEELGGAVTLTFDIGTDGKVKGPKLDAATTLSDRDVARCVLRYLSTTQFPAPDRGKVTVRSSIDFAPPSSVVVNADGSMEQRENAHPTIP